MLFLKGDGRLFLAVLVQLVEIQQDGFGRPEVRDGDARSDAQDHDVVLEELKGNGEILFAHDLGTKGELGPTGTLVLGNDGGRRMINPQGQLPRVHGG